MARISCPVAWCARPMPAARRACAACTSELERDLADVPDLTDNLQLALAKQVRMSDARAGRGGETPLPYDRRAGQAAAHLHRTIVAWVQSLRAGVTVTYGPACAAACGHPTCTYITLATEPGPSTAAHSRWLLRHLRVLLGRHNAPDAVEQLTTAIRQARHVIDRPLDQVYAGPCNVCDRDMYAQPGESYVTCVCRAGYGVRARREWMLAEVEEMRLSAVDVARALTSLDRPIKPALLATWVQRGRLVPVGTDAHGKPLYRVGDVMELMETQESRAVHA